MPLWKSGSTAGRPKAAHAKSIRGTISNPIPLPSPLDDDEFPIRNPGTGIASTSPTSNDDEFPIRKRGTGIASPAPPEGDLVEADESLVQDSSPVQLFPDGLEEKIDTTEIALDPEPESVQPSPEDPSALSPVADESDVSPEAAPEPPSDPPPVPPLPSTEYPGVSAPISIPPVSRVSTSREFALRNSPPREVAKTSPEDSPPARASPPRASAPAPTTRTTYPATARYSTVSDATTGQTGQSKDNKDMPSRKKSTLRSTFSKLFGRKKKKNSASLDMTRASSQIPEHPSSLQNQADISSPSRPKETDSKRSVSLPITEFDRPLRSHSIGPDDIIAIESVRNSLQADLRPSRRRAATASANKLYPQPRRYSEWDGGLSPRPASTHARGGLTEGNENPEEIGRAITSDHTNLSANGQRRRSRSLSGLKDYTAEGGDGRRRSDEIKYWRESYDRGFLSPLSSNAQEDNETVGDKDIDPESPLVDRPPMTPPQPFNFGSISKDMVGMKITQAATIDIRIANLEARADKVDRVVNQLCHSVPGFKSPMSPGVASGEPSPEFEKSGARPPTVSAVFQGSTIALQSPPRHADSRHSVETDAPSQVSFGDAPTYTDSLGPPSATQPQSLMGNMLPVFDRPTSTSTVRGAASLPTMGRGSDGSAGARLEPYTSLLAQLETERAARQTLEAQVSKLSERLNSLSATLFAMTGGPNRSRSQEPLAPVSDTLKPSAPNSHGVKTLSVFETSDDEDTTKSGAGLGVVVGDDESVLEDFQTPHEELYPPQMYGAFGEELREDDVGDDQDDDPKRKKAARTLSLSQLTLKKGAQVPRRP